MTLTLELSPEMESRLREMASRQDPEALRQLLAKAVEPAVRELMKKPLSGCGEGDMAADERRQAFKVESHAFGFKPGVDLERMNRLVDELEAAEVAGRLLNDPV